MIAAASAWRSLSLPKSRFGRGVAVLAGGSAVGQLATLIGSPILTRLYDADAFGALSVYAALLAVSSVVVSLRYEQAVPLPARDRAAANVFVLALLVGAALTGVAALTGTLVMSAGLGRRFAPIRPYLWLLPVGTFGAALYQALRYWAIRQRAFPRIARTSIGQSTAQAAMQVGLGFLRIGPLGLLLGHAAGQYNGILTLWRGLGPSDRAALRAVRRRRIVWAARRYRRFPAYSAGASLLNMLGLQLPALFFAAHYGLQVAGWLALGQRLLAVPLRLVGGAVAQVYLGEAARLHRTDAAGLRALFKSTSRRLIVVGLIPVAVLLVLAPWAFALAFGADWREAGVYVQILALALLAQFVVSPLSQTLNVTGRQNWQLGWDACRTAAVAGCFATVVLLDLSPRVAIALYAGTLLATYVVLYLMLRLSLGYDMMGGPSGEL